MRSPRLCVGVVGYFVTDFGSMSIYEGAQIKDPSFLVGVCVRYGKGHM